MSEGPLVFAFVAGTVASANPCGFAVLPAFFLSYATSPDSPGAAAPRRVAQALLAGGAMTLAFAVVFGGVGAGLAAGAGVLMPAMPWATIVVGLALLALGVAVLAGRRVSLRLPDPLARGGGGYRGPFLFGAGYAVASLSCTLPIFLAVVGASLGGGGLAVRAGVFLAYAVGMGVVLTVLAIGAALARGGVHRALRRLVPHVSRLSGLFLVAAGAYLLYYWTFFLLPGSETRTAGKGPIDALNDLTNRLQAWLGSAGGIWVGRALLGLVFVLAVLTVWWILRARRRARKPSEERPRERLPAARR